MLTTKQHGSSMAPYPICPRCGQPLLNVVLRPGKKQERVYGDLNLGNGTQLRPQTQPVAALGECPRHGVTRLDFVP